ncbi:MAG: CDP-diacylglycerol--glycerol-3-phosphate 3-phosphatidyltransferase [Acidimicrobiales bacterium]
MSGLRGSVLHHSGHFVTNPANLITVARIAASPLLFAAVLANEDSGGASWFAFTLGWIFAATDLLDGELARRFDMVSRSGAFLDPLADKIVVLGSMFCLVAVDRYGWIPVALITVREAGITVYRSYWVRQGRTVPARTLGKYKSIIQGLALIAAVFPPWESSNLIVPALLWLAVAFTLYSGLMYLIDGSAATRASGNLNEA